MRSSLVSAIAKGRSPGDAFRPLVLAVSLFFAGCVQLAEVDSTHSPVYASMVGRAFELKTDFFAHGIKLPDQRTPEPQYILIMPPPRIRGHLVIDLDRIPAGSRFRIVGVVTHRSKLFPSTEYSIAFDDPRAFQANGRPIRINATTHSWHLYVKPASPDAPPQLNPEYFKAVASP